MKMYGAVYTARECAGWGMALKERQCTLKGQARYVNVRGSVHCKGVCRVGDKDLGVQNFFFGFLKLTNQRRPKVTCLVRH